MDSFGEIFHQVFTETISDSQDVTFSTGQGSQNLTPDAMATKLACDWLTSWDSQALKYTREKQVYKEIKLKMYGTYVFSTV